MTEKVSFSVTTYEGHEKEVLEILNRNRPEKFSVKYLNWRYLGEKSPIPPIVFWIHSEDGTRIGMSALIFRSYWVNDKRHYFAISGDTSISKECRGKGAGKKLFKFKTAYIKDKRYTCAFGIGTPAAVRVVSHAGWETVDNLSPYVYLINISGKIYKVIKNKSLAKIIEYLYVLCSKTKLFLLKNSSYNLIAVEDFDDSFDSFWVELDKKNIVLRDRSSAILRWRYSTHPFEKISTYKIIRNQKFVGYIIWKQLNNMVIIYDLIVIEKDHIKPSLRLFIKEILKIKEIESIRIPLINVNHPYASKLIKTGFIKRSDEGVFQIYSPTNTEEYISKKWFVSNVDKDI